MQLGHIADGKTVDFIFHHGTIVTLPVVSRRFYFIFTVAQLCWMGT